MNLKQSKLAKAVSLAVAIGLGPAAGVSVSAEISLEISEALAMYDLAASDKGVIQDAGDELERAREALNQARELEASGAPRSKVEHQAYLAAQQVQIAQQTALLKAAERARERAQSEQTRLAAQAEADRAAAALKVARERTEQAEAVIRSTKEQMLEAELTELQARKKSEVAEQAIGQAKAQSRAAAKKDLEAELKAKRAAEIEDLASDKLREAEHTRLNAIMRTEQAERIAHQAELKVQSANERAAKAEARAEHLEKLFNGLNAKETERGHVVTIADVLFDVDSASLQPSGYKLVRQIADYLKASPDARILVEGFTDSTGKMEYNQSLSERRAKTVRDALTFAGIDPMRIEFRGYGESFPVASNESHSGRQQNRRVEVVISESNASIEFRDPTS